MSTGTSQNLRPAKFRTAASARDAYSRWGFAGQAGAGKLDTYTAEHYAADVERGVIVNVARTAKGCPRRRPERECRPDDVPEYYRSSWRQRKLVPAAAPTPAKPYSTPRRKWTAGKAVCLDCRLWLEWLDRQALIEELGSYSLDYTPPPRIVDFGEMERGAEQRALADYRDIYTLAGHPESQIDWLDARVLAASVRHFSHSFMRVAQIHSRPNP